MVVHPAPFEGQGSLFIRKTTNSQLRLLSLRPETAKNEIN
jgi:hypothetical protein